VNPATPAIGSGAKDRGRVALAFGSTLREVRRARGLTQEELALAGGFDRTYPSLLERSHRSQERERRCEDDLVR
jgi:DNA-binding XRE family transcriptional regulator